MFPCSKWFLGNKSKIITNNRKNKTMNKEAEELVVAAKSKIKAEAIDDLIMEGVLIRTDAERIFELIRNGRIRHIRTTFGVQ